MDSVQHSNGSVTDKGSLQGTVPVKSMLANGLLWWWLFAKLEFVWLAMAAKVRGGNDANGDDESLDLDLTSLCIGKRWRD